MILLQLSAGQGPVECCQAVALAVKAVEKQCKTSDLNCTVIDASQGENKLGFKSALLQIESNQKATALTFAQTWQGAMLWVCQSKYRPQHKRKNWFFSGQVYQVDEITFDREIVYQTCRASGAGGQHVNTTDSAVRATHTSSGVSVRVESERSQHANKRLAKALLFQKLQMAQQQKMSQQEQARWQQHWQLQRGSPVKIFKGEKFVLSQ